MLAQYDQISTGCANRIIAMAESQAEHRQGLEKTVVNRNASNERLGQVFAFILGFTAIAGGIYLIASDKDIQGLIAVIGALGSLSAVFIYGRMQQAKERQQSRNELPGRG